MSEKVQTAEDLERALAEIDRYYSGAISGRLEEAVLLHWPTIRAALARERELREALRELRQAETDWWKGDPTDWNAAMEKADALLAQPAAGEERK